MPPFRWKSKNWGVKVYHAASKTKVLKIGYIGQTSPITIKILRSVRLGQKLPFKGKSSKIWVLRSKMSILSQNPEIRVLCRKYTFRLEMPYLGRKCQHFCYKEWTFKAKIEIRVEKYCSLEQNRKLHRCYQPILL